VFPCRRCLLTFAVEAAVILTPQAPALSFDDGEFCVAAQQLALAANNDVDLWLDRVTRNDGVSVSCEKRLVEFKRSVRGTGTSLDQSWRERKGGEWNDTHCHNRIWSEAILNGWNIAASFTASDGARVTIRAHCN
jgi:hypothetical protein